MNKITSADLKNYGAISEFSCDKFSNINLVIGENGTGKTFLLKALYSATRAVEEYKRGDDIRTINEVLAEKLRWTFQVDKLGDMVTRSSDESLNFKMELGANSIGYQFSQSAASKVGTAVAPSEKRRQFHIYSCKRGTFIIFSDFKVERD